jgi:hypothetical protein
MKISDAAFARLLGIERLELRQTRDYADALLNEHILRGWLIDAARAAIRNPQTRR